MAACIPAGAQLVPSEPDPLAHIRDAAKTNVQACSATGKTLCEQVAPKIVANAQGDSRLAQTIHNLIQGPRDQKNAAALQSPAIAWAVAAFHDAGLEARIEKYGTNGPEAQVTAGQQANVVAEIRGRESPDEWVLLGARIDPSNPLSVEEACNAALVIEAARDIQLTGIHPRRSIRFVLFVGSRTVRGSRAGEAQVEAGSWEYLKEHHNELDRARAAVLFAAGGDRVNGFVLNGRRDIESGVREALSPIDSMGVTTHSFNAPLERDSLDFILEGIPTLVAPAEANDLAVGRNASKSSDTLDKIDIGELKRSTAIAAVAAFGIAERAEPIGPRQSRAEIESLLMTTGLDEQVKAEGLWTAWESGQRGRLP